VTPYCLVRAIHTSQWELADAQHKQNWCNQSGGPGSDLLQGSSASTQSLTSHFCAELWNLPRPRMLKSRRYIPTSRSSGAPGGDGTVLSSYLNAQRSWDTNWSRSLRHHPNRTRFYAQHTRNQISLSEITMQHADLLLKAWRNLGDALDKQYAMT
jgi:hypothetical protein